MPDLYYLSCHMILSDILMNFRCNQFIKRKDYLERPCRMRAEESDMVGVTQ